MSSVKRYKKGEVFFKEGEACDKVFFIQSGRVSLFIERSGRKIELEQLQANQVLGEQAIFNPAKQTYSAEAASEVRAIELPVEILKAQNESAPPGIKLLSKTLCGDIRRTRGTIRSFKMDQDNSPCPQRFIPRLFSILVMVASHIGHKPQQQAEGNSQNYKPMEAKEENPLNGPDDIIVSWNALRIQASRMFLESPVRMQAVVELLSKLRYVSLKKEMDEEDEIEVLSEIRIHNLEMIEQFCEFYQHNLYKGGRAEVIYVDRMALNMAETLIELSKEVEADRNGVVELKYDELIQTMREEFEIELRDTHLNILEKKGLYVKRKTRDDQTYLSFDRHEFNSIMAYWQIINEIDKWNEHGIVNLNEDLFAKKKKSINRCGECKTKYDDGQKFCAECGSSLVMTDETALPEAA